MNMKGDPARYANRPAADIPPPQCVGVELWFYHKPKLPAIAFGRNENQDQVVLLSGNQKITISPG